MSWKIKSSLLIFALSLSGFANASDIQYFWANSFNNPAMLNSTKNQSYKLGVLGVKANFSFWGTGASGLNGRATSNTSDFIPYFAGAYRVNSKVVVGLNVSPPYYGNYDIGPNPVTIYNGTASTMYSSDISPQISYQATDKLALGLGFDAVNFRDVTYDFGLLPVPEAGVTHTKSGAWAYGWNVGLFFTPTERDYIGLYYYSKLTPTFKGTSYNNIAATNNFSITGYPIAASTFINYIRVLTDKWMLNMIVSYSQWNKLKTIRANNVATAGNISFTLNANNTYNVFLSAKYQATDKYAVLAGVSRDGSDIRNDTRDILTSTARFGFAAIGGTAQVTKEALVQVLVGYGNYRNSPVIFPYGTVTNGHLNLSATAVDATITYDI
ncbi:MAG TPA: outer membrane protein transport protein [Gammaproteobacteria bacterium]|jgi:long-chain fatty acid transport protein|nr:outer membrane protein transport protein [Gammaproteobacteria bacterium]